MVPWKRIGLVLKGGQGDLAPLLDRVMRTLARHPVEVILETQAAAQLPGHRGLPLDEVAARAELLIALGGDGTVLTAVRAIGPRSVPVLGVNLGRLGFLTHVNPDEAEVALDEILGGQYDLCERSRLEVRCLGASGDEPLGLVLNDAVLGTTADVARLIELETRIDGRLVSRYRADGLILATPTGSTAYNLSAGGPLLDQSVSAITVTPICPHALSQRALVISDELSIEVRLCSADDIRLTLDGQVGRVLRMGEAICVRRSAHSAFFVATSRHDRFETLRTKLGWGT